MLSCAQGSPRWDELCGLWDCSRVLVASYLAPFAAVAHVAAVYFPLDVATFGC